MAFLEQLLITINLISSFENYNFLKMRKYIIGNISYSFRYTVSWIKSDYLHVDSRLQEYRSGQCRLEYKSKKADIKNVSPGLTK